MKRYAEFYHRGVISGNLIPACGSDSIVFLDARHSLENQKEYARSIALQRGFLGYRIMAYPILPERPLTPVYTI